MKNTKYNIQSGTHGFRVKSNPYESKWDHIPVKETTQRLINISKTHRKRNKPKLCFTTSTRSIPIQAFYTPPSMRPSSAPATTHTEPVCPTPPQGEKPNYNTRKIRSAVPRVNLEEKKEDERSKSPVFELKRTPRNVEMKVQIEETEMQEKLKTAQAEKFLHPARALTDEIERLKHQILDLEDKLVTERKLGKEHQQKLQVEFNKSLARTLEEKKKELRRVKEQHYADINALKYKMNEALKLQRSESSLATAKLKGQIDCNRENFRNFKSSQDKAKQQHSEDLQDLHHELTMQHQREKANQLRELEEKMLLEKELALETLQNKLTGEISLLKEQHATEVAGILHTFDGINIEEVEANRHTIREQEIQLMTYRGTQRKLEEEIRGIMNELASHKSALKQLQDSFFDKVHEVDQKYIQQISSLLVDNKDLRKRYLKMCDELFTLKAAYNRLQEAKGYIAREILHAILQGKQPHVITSSAVRANWTTDGVQETRRTSQVRWTADRASTVEEIRRTGDRASTVEEEDSASSSEDPAALMLSTCTYIHDNSGSRNPKPISETMFPRDDFLLSTPPPISRSSSEGNLAVATDDYDGGKLTERRPVSSVCVVRPHTRVDVSLKPRATSADPRTRQPKMLDVSEFNLPALPVSPKRSRRKSDEMGEVGE